MRDRLLLERDRFGDLDRVRRDDELLSFSLELRFFDFLERERLRDRLLRERDRFFDLDRLRDPRDLERVFERFLADLKIYEKQKKNDKMMNIESVVVSLPGTIA